jgi:hypothetical protein
LRYRGAAMAEFWRALRTLKALQAEPALSTGAPLQASPTRPAARPASADRSPPNEPERGAERRVAYVLPEPAATGRTLHEAANLWRPNEPESAAAPHAPAPGKSADRPPRMQPSGPAAGYSCAAPPGLLPAHAARRIEAAADDP